MSFYVEFTAESGADAEKIVAEEKQLPDGVKAFLVQALQACQAAPVRVKANGHLFSGNDHKVSNAAIEVVPLSFRVPKELPPAG